MRYFDIILLNIYLLKPRKNRISSSDLRRARSFWPAQLTK